MEMNVYKYMNYEM